MVLWISSLKATILGGFEGVLYNAVLKKKKSLQGIFLSNAL